MRRLLIGAILVLVSLGQGRATTYERIVFSSTAVGFNSNTIHLNAPQRNSEYYPSCVGRLETAAIRVRDDGYAPTASVGIPVSVGESVTIRGMAWAEAFQGIATTATPGVIQFYCEH